MQYRNLGRSGLKVSALAMGTATFGGSEPWGNTEVEEARRQIDLCLDHGVNLIDTANAYGNGASETILGEVLQGGRRDRVLVATKIRFGTGSGPNDRGLSRWHIVRECEASLKRLRTEVIDLYQVHEWDGQTPIEETMEALDTLVKQGKVRYLGCSNYSAWHLMKALAAADAARRERFVAQQIHYTLHSREAEFELLPLGFDPGRVGDRLVAPGRRLALGQVHPDLAARLRPARDRLPGAADLRLGPALGHRGRRERGRGRAGRIGRAGVPGLAPPAAHGGVRDRGRENGGAVRGHPEGGLARAGPPIRWPGSMRSAAHPCLTPTGTRASPRATGWARPT
ncbi:aldo/keto reductase [Rubellimicrobium mesophilum DSM 19309]|uniref:Aldo/keto reductase n=1 Tax=Rubellimicrobium mesophilum DSM 19309 TaxID=442562 RepID=A0A017HSZ7_9RHOB|nr:aldo/keto reductase [Rubellimicrobium mesophilum DSM 19309]